jgi:hypothetical protein
MDEKDENIKKITKMYDNLSYLDQYGNSVILIILITLILFLLIAYSFIMINIVPIRNNWVAERCKPYVIPFAGIINAPEGTSITDFTQENFTYCMQNVTSSLAENAVSPLTFITSSLTMVANIIQNSINAIREMVNNIRNSLQSVTQEVMGRLMNFIVPLQEIIIKIKDMLMKTQGVFTGVLYTLFGAYFTLKSLLGAIAELVIKILIGLAVAIVILWLIPFTWGAAAAGTGVFAIIAAFLTYILVFMTDVLHVQTGLTIPKLKCFDKNTLIQLKDGSEKKIIDICLGDILVNDGIVTAKFKVDIDRSQMYVLNNVIVSDTHMVLYNDKFIRVSNHPLARKLAFYDEKYLYCLNTSKKEIVINGIVFSDWDEVNAIEINCLENEAKEYTICSENKDDTEKDDLLIHKYLDSGFISSTKIKLKNGETKDINKVEINDILENGEKVYGIVEIDGEKMDNQYVYYLGNNKIIEGAPNLVFYDNNNKINTTLDLNLYASNNCKKLRKKTDTKLFHLLTNKETFVVNGIKFKDYNASIDIFLEK